MNKRVEFDRYIFLYCGFCGQKHKSDCPQKVMMIVINVSQTIAFLSIRSSHNTDESDTSMEFVEHIE
jgi:hypothetical protein